MNEFNPTKKDLLSIESLILDIKKKKSLYVANKMRYENTLSELKSKYKDVDFNDSNFKRIKSTRQNIKNYLSEIELKLREVNNELAYKNKLKLEVEFYIRNHKTEKDHSDDLKKTIDLISKLKMKYNEFSKDRTRISSLRVMACEFIDDLNELIEKI